MTRTEKLQDCLEFFYRQGELCDRPGILELRQRHGFDADSLIDEIRHKRGFISIDKTKSCMILNQDGINFYDTGGFTGEERLSNDFELRKKIEEEEERQIRLDVSKSEINYYKEQSEFIKAQKELAETTRDSLVISKRTLDFIKIYTAATIVLIFITLYSTCNSPTSKDMKDINSSIKGVNAQKEWPNTK